MRLNAASNVYGCIDAHACMLCRWNHLYVTPQYSSEQCHSLMRSVLLLPNICAPRALCKHLISYGLLYNTSLVNNVPLLIRERRLIEQISAGWDDKPCQAPKRLQITRMQCIPHIVCCISALFCSHSLGASKAISQTGATNIYSFGFRRISTEISY